MKKVMLYLGTICFLVSCEKFVDEEEDTNEVVLDEIYELKDIKYFLLVGADAIKEDTLLLNSAEFVNNSSIEIKFPFVMHKNFFLESEFMPNNYTPFKVKVDESQKIVVPTEIENNEIITGNRYFTYIEDVKTSYRLSPEYTEMFECSPFSTLTVKEYLHFSRIKMGYRVIFEWKQTGKEQVVEGLWTGKQIRSSVTHIVIGDIKK